MAALVLIYSQTSQLLFTRELVNVVRHFYHMFVLDGTVYCAFYSDWFIELSAFRDNNIKVFQ